MATQAAGSFHVYGEPTEVENIVLDTADEFRDKLVRLTHQRHKAFIELRNELFPELFDALCRFESCNARIWQIEREIKRHHSDVLDRNAVTDEQAEALQEQRGIREHLGKEIKRLRVAWSSTAKAFSMHWQQIADWKNVKTLSKRKQAYAELPEFPQTAEPYVKIADSKGKELPGLVASTIPRYAAVWMEFDILERELGQEFAERLHPAIRAEIVEASQPKLTKTSPGIRYEYHREPQPRPWTKLTIQFGDGGLSLEKAFAGTTAFKLTPIYTNHTASGDVLVCDVTQQIGTKKNSVLITYRAKIHRPFAEDAVLKRWSLIIDGGKRSCVPLVASEIVPNHTGKGAFRYSLSWTKKKAGIEVAHFVGHNVNERLIVPHWLVERRLRFKEVQQQCDLQANGLLTLRGCAPQPKSKQGVEALKAYAENHVDDAAAVNLLDSLEVSIERSMRDARSAMVAIEQIYHVAARRICDRHDSYEPCDLDLARLKRYDTRDLLQPDVIPEPSREILFAVSPGKLKQFIAARKLPVASVEVLATIPADARETTLVSSYVESLGVKTGTKTNQPCRRSQSVAEPATIS